MKISQLGKQPMTNIRKQDFVGMARPRTPLMRENFQDMQLVMEAPVSLVQHI